VISQVLGDAAEVYRRLWRRSVLVAGLVFAVVELAAAFAARSGTVRTGFVSLVLALIGGLLVQGALVYLVADLHQGRPAPALGELYNRARDRLGTLLGASLLYGVGVAIGFLLLIVPGLIAVARWSLVVPLVMVEGQSVGDALARSNALVKGKTGRVLLLVIIVNVITGVTGYAIRRAFGFLPDFAAFWIGGTIASAFVVPYQAHTLTVLYYRLTEPDRPILPA
jgi:hypothetical protein